MSLKNVKLPANLIASLYTAPLVCLQNEESTALPTADPVKFLGSNQKHITILVNESNAVFLTDTSLAFLTDILNACRLNMSDVAIINICQSMNNHYTVINSTTRPQIMLLLGVSPQEIGLPLCFPHFQIQPFNNTTYVCAPHLGNIRDDQSLKAKLWTSLKSVFQLF